MIRQITGLLDKIISLCTMCLIVLIHFIDAMHGAYDDLESETSGYSSMRHSVFYSMKVVKS